MVYTTLWSYLDLLIAVFVSGLLSCYPVVSLVFVPVSVCVCASGAARVCIPVRSVEW